MDHERSKLIDELGTLQKRLAPYSKDIAREKDLKAKIRSWPADDKVAPDATKAYEGAKFTATLGICEEERAWKPTAKATLFARLKKAAFLGMCGVTLKAATEAVGEAGIADLTTKERTGSRPLIVAERA